MRPAKGSPCTRQVSRARKAALSFRLAQASVFGWPSRTLARRPARACPARDTRRPFPRGYSTLAGHACRGRGWWVHRAGRLAVGGARFLRMGASARRGCLVAAVCCCAALGACGPSSDKSNDERAGRIPAPAPRPVLSADDREVWAPAPPDRAVVPVLLYHGVAPVSERLLEARGRRLGDRPGGFREADGPAGSCRLRHDHAGRVRPLHQARAPRQPSAAAAAADIRRRAPRLLDRERRDLAQTRLQRRAVRRCRTRGSGGP